KNYLFVGVSNLYARKKKHLFMKKQLIKLRSQLMVALVEKTKTKYIRFFKKDRQGWGISVEQLATFPIGSLGQDLANFLRKENFDLMAGLEDHDVYHVLLGYSTEVEQEAQMQFFLLGNGKRSLYAIGTSLVAFCTMPDQWLTFWDAYRKGQKSAKIHLWDFRYLLKEKTSNLQNLLYSSSRRTNPTSFFIVTPH
ncbi:MAG: hypothetical protein AAGJ18_11005, partial [Bacteroidota bacterium]